MQNDKNEGENEKILILAVVGMPATGKSEVIKKLKEQFNFYHLYYGGITLDEVKRRGLELNEVNEKFVREDMRKSGDMGIYSRFMIPKIEDAIKNGYKNILLESMYNIYEYEIIKEKYGENFKVLAIHTDTEIRIKRINSRKDRKLTKEELISRQISEAKNLQKGTVISFADFNHTNNGDDMEQFEKDLEEIIRSKILR
jgi:dephospho-CoA kinase